jgi:hypothetical protein
MGGCRYSGNEVGRRSRDPRAASEQTGAISCAERACLCSWATDTRASSPSSATTATRRSTRSTKHERATASRDGPCTAARRRRVILRSGELGAVTPPPPEHSPDRAVRRGHRPREPAAAPPAVAPAGSARSTEAGEPSAKAEAGSRRREAPCPDARRSLPFAAEPIELPARALHGIATSGHGMTPRVPAPGFRSRP